MKIPGAISYYSLSENDPLSHLRILSPMRTLGIEVIKAVRNGRVDISKVPQGDLVVIQRDFPRHFKDYRAVMAAARAAGKPVVYDIDDWLFELPPEHPDRISQYYAAALFPVYQAVAEADLVSVATPALRDAIRRINPRAVVLPNYLDETIWQLRPPTHPESADGRLVIGYMGGHTHQHDFEIIEPVLGQLLREYPGRLAIHFWGMKPPRSLAKQAGVEWCHAPIWDYPDFAHYFQGQSVDLFVAPLTDNSFNHCKSPIKFLEYSALGSPGIYSRVTPYSGVVQSGENGFLAGSEAEWHDALVHLIESPDLRLRLAQNAQALVRREWLLAGHAGKWRDAYRGVMQKRPDAGRDERKRLLVLDSINLQTTAYQESREKKIAALVNEHSRLSARLAQAQQEVAAVSQRESDLIRRETDLKRFSSETLTRVNELEFAIATDKIALRNQSAMLDRINNSFGYRMLLSFREGVDRMMPQGSRRRRLYESGHVLLRTGVANAAHLLRYHRLPERRPVQVEADKAVAPASSMESAQPVPAGRSIYEEAYLGQLQTAYNIQDGGYVEYRDHPEVPDPLSIRLIAFYLPQFHPIPENDRWWGRGFTEWTNVSKAAPQFAGQYQPHVPGELGYYDLRLWEVQQRQIELARNYGIHGFSFYYYWFKGKRLLERPIEQFIAHPEMKFPFCFTWANENWTRRWDGRETDILISQEHTFQQDFEIIKDLVPAFRDKRYIRINGRPLLIVYRSNILDDPRRTFDAWREYSEKKGCGNPYLLVAQTFGFEDPREVGADAAVEFPPNNIGVPEITSQMQWLNPDFRGHVFEYADLARNAVEKYRQAPYNLYPTVCPAWDNVPRRNQNGYIFAHSSPAAYREWLASACRLTAERYVPSERLVFINAWNEWAEGAHLEPDRRFGYGYLEATCQALTEPDPEGQLAAREDRGFERLSGILQVRRRYRELVEPLHGTDEPGSPPKALARIVSASHDQDPVTDPEASIIIPVYNHLTDTLRCLYSLAQAGDRTRAEILVIDDASGDETRMVLSKFRGIRYIRNPKNLGFLASCNRAAGLAKGRTLVFLNNDTVVTPGWLDELVGTFTEQVRAGLVGAKLLYPDGRLQEAGGIIWKDGGGINYGREDDPLKPQYNYLREADYCSGACIAIPHKLWSRLGGFDPRFAPAYYEDTDLAFRVRKAGYQVLYQPRSEVFHLEGVTSGVDVQQGVKHYQEVNRHTFHERWRNTIRSHGLPGEKAEYLNRNHMRKQRALVIDVIVPRPDTDSGSIDTYQYLRSLRGLGYEVTFIADVRAEEVDHYVHDLQRIGIEVIYKPYLVSIEEFLNEFRDRFDLVFLFRAMHGGKFIDQVKETQPGAKVVFNTVDLNFLREERGEKLRQAKPPRRGRKAGSLRAIELAIMAKADRSIVVSTEEGKLVAKLAPRVATAVIPIPREIPGRKAGYAQRRDILFIGGFLHKPNVDAVQYFVTEIWPRIKERLPDCCFVIVGSNVPAEMQALDGPDIQVLGHVPDLDGIFSTCRLTVAPLRFGAGVKGKIVTSLAYGVPCVATGVAVEGMGLTPDEDILVGEKPEEFARAVISLYQDPELWMRLSENGLKLAEDRYGLEAFKRNLRVLIAGLDDRNGDRPVRARSS